MFQIFDDTLVDHYARPRERRHRQSQMLDTTPIAVILAELYCEMVRDQ